MAGTYFANPDCLISVELDRPLVRSKDELSVAALSLDKNGILVINKAEFASIKREVGLGYSWSGRRLFVL